ncbi:metal-dependent hydrolase family protein [Stakelama tenebrarum]|uniref:Amidohydrolase family protein n=1 Tax=Stakelama tenebrarum TaxID=2711215 RepID=A0A6G6Y7T0_9SPHN|nr:amidohydrolase family protein [Sphingosinithalassobacter tenebrarum]QIG80768.1 amidohydrolase family protein [Sphingosinithalassobacter tenebrarum]
MSNILITGARIFDGSGADAFAGDLLVEGNSIKTVSNRPGSLPTEGCTVIDGSGMFLMPGMTEGHTHLSFENVCATEDLMKPTPETQAFTAARGAKALIDAGFTSAYGASEAKLQLAIAVREEVNAGRLPGPRIRAGGLEISVTGAMGDEAKDHDPRIGPSTIIDGVEEMRKAVRLHCRAGVDNIKLDVSGDPFYPSTPGHTTPMTYDEVKTAADTAHDYGRKINAHTRSIEGSKYCVRAGVDGLFHCEYSDEELLDLMEEAKDRIFVVPTVGLFHQILKGEASAHGLTPEVGGYMNIPDLMENSIKTHTELRKRGVRHLIGGDYGFGWSKQGEQARDLQFFMQYYGYSAADALVCATRNGGLAMHSQGDLGMLAEGQLADMVLVNGDPLADISVLTEHDRLVLIMKAGAIHKNSMNMARQGASAATNQLETVA